MPESITVGYEMEGYSFEIDDPVVFQTDGRLPLAVRDSVVDSLSSALILLLYSAFNKEKHWTDIFFPVEERKSLKQMVCFCGAYKNSKEWNKGGDEKESFRASMVSLYQFGFGTAFFAKSGVDIQHREYAILHEIETFAEASEKLRQSLKYPDTFRESFSKHFLRFVHVTFAGRVAWKDGANRTL